MSDHTAMCGFDCRRCPVFIATRNEDAAMKAQLLDEYFKEYPDTTLADLNCDGCLAASGRIFRKCAGCAIRVCGLERAVATCADCAAYPDCDKLQTLFTHSPNAKAALEAIRKEIETTKHAEHTENELLSPIDDPPLG